MLLPSGPDMVHSFLLHKTDSSTPLIKRISARNKSQSGNSILLQRIVGYRAPLPPHLVLAENGGFEPPVRLNTAHMISNHAPSTTRTTLHISFLIYTIISKAITNYNKIVFISQIIESINVGARLSNVS